MWFVIRFSNRDDRQWLDRYHFNNFIYVLKLAHILWIYSTPVFFSMFVILIFLLFFKFKF